MSTFVSIGNAKQQFPRFFEIVDSVSLLLPKPVIIQSGHTDYHNVEFQVIPFIEMTQFAEFVAEAQLLILHSGAGSIIHAVQSGKKPIVIPRLSKYGEHVDDHQLELAQHLATAGKVYLVQNTEDMQIAVKQALKTRPDDCKDNYRSKASELLDSVFRRYAD